MLTSSEDFTIPKLLIKIDLPTLKRWMTLSCNKCSNFNALRSHNLISHHDRCSNENEDEIERHQPLFQSLCQCLSSALLQILQGGSLGSCVIFPFKCHLTATQFKCNPITDSSILGHIRVSRDGAEELEQEERARHRPHQVRGIVPCHTMLRRLG